MWLWWTFAMRWLVTVFHLKYFFIYIQGRLIYFNSRYYTFHSIFILLFMFQSRLFLGLHIGISIDVYIPFRHIMFYSLICHIICSAHLFPCLYILGCQEASICSSRGSIVTEFYAPCIYFVYIFIYHLPCIFCVYFIHIKCYFNNVMFLICR